eukprot:gene20691-26824_t
MAKGLKNTLTSPIIDKTESDDDMEDEDNEEIVTTDSTTNDEVAPLVLRSDYVDKTVKKYNRDMSCNILESTSINKFTRVAIVGSGPGGLGLAACFNKIDCGVKFVDIYESRSSILQPSLGGGLQLSGGAAVIDKIGCYNELKSIALPFKQVL